MPADFKDYVQLPAIGASITPTGVSTPGVLSTITNVQISNQVAALTTSTGVCAGPQGPATVIGGSQTLAVTGTVYNSPGNYRGNAPNQSGTVAAGGGP